MERNPIKTRRNIRTTAVAQKKSGNNGLKKIQFKLNLGSGSQLKTRVELEETLDERVVGGFREKKTKERGRRMSMNEEETAGTCWLRSTSVSRASPRPSCGVSAEFWCCWISARFACSSQIKKNQKEKKNNQPTRETDKKKRNQSKLGTLIRDHPRVPERWDHKRNQVESKSKLVQKPGPSQGSLHRWHQRFVDRGYSRKSG